MNLYTSIENNPYLYEEYKTLLTGVLDDARQDKNNFFISTEEFSKDTLEQFYKDNKKIDYLKCFKKIVMDCDICSEDNCKPVLYGFNEHSWWHSRTDFSKYFDLLVNDYIDFSGEVSVSYFIAKTRECYDSVCEDSDIKTGWQALQRGELTYRFGFDFRKRHFNNSLDFLQKTLKLEREILLELMNLSNSNGLNF